MRNQKEYTWNDGRLIKRTGSHTEVLQLLRIRDFDNLPAERLVSMRNWNRFLKLTFQLSKNSYLPPEQNVGKGDVFFQVSKIDEN